MALTALADWLFYGQEIGISFAVFMIFIGLAFLACLPHALTPHRIRRASLMLAAAALPWVADAGWNQFHLSLAGGAWPAAPSPVPFYRQHLVMIFCVRACVRSWASAGR